MWWMVYVAEEPEVGRDSGWGYSLGSPATAAFAPHVSGPSPCSADAPPGLLEDKENKVRRAALVRVGSWGGGGHLDSMALESNR